MQQVRGAVRSYAWGSHTAIAELTGRAVPTDHPEAELWLGAHPADPAQLLGPHGNTSLLTAIESAPEALLGAACRRQFGDRLPFLLKVLAAAQPLSLQAHPSALQAKQGFAAEQAQGIPLDSPLRSYRDEHPKPELLCALSTFEALVGFRRIDRTVGVLTALDCPPLAPYRALLVGQPDANGLRALLTTWLTMPASALHTLLSAVLPACRALSAGNGEFAGAAQTTAELGERYPGDVGVLASLLLNRVTLRPGEALFLPAGNLHAYLHGVGIEVMGNSDNVLRGGLTPKHVDVPELLRVLDFTAGEIDVLTGSLHGCEREYPAPATEFRLSRLELGPGAAIPVAHGGPQLLLCAAGSARLVGEKTELVLGKGTAAWVPADQAVVTVIAAATGAALFRVRDGLDQR